MATAKRERQRANRERRRAEEARRRRRQEALAVVRRVATYGIVFAGVLLAATWLFGR